MAKWINRDTDKIGTFGEEETGNRSNESNQNLRVFAKTKYALPTPIFADEDITLRAKY